MPYTINLFMWGYQRHFLSSVEHRARELFELLQPKAKFGVFLVGILTEPQPDSHPICLEPEECGFLPSDFEKVEEYFKVFEKLDPEYGRFHTHQKAQDSLNNRVKVRAWQKSITKACSARSRYHFYCAGPQRVGGYSVFLVSAVQFPDNLLPYSIPKLHCEDRYEYDSSFFDTAINRFLARCTSALYAPDPTLVEGVEMFRPEEILHRAAERFMCLPSYATGKIENLGVLFKACEEISSLKYERSEVRQRLIICREDHPNIEFAFKFQIPIAVSEYQSIRKLLELPRGNDCLICDGAQVTGVGHLIGKYNPLDADLFEVQFVKHRSWVLIHDSHILLHVEYGKLQSLLPRLDRKQCEVDFTRLLKSSPILDIKLLLELASKASEQGKGSILIVHSKAEDEAKRLSKESIPIVPFKLSPEQLSAVTSIDGAVLIDPSGICHAIGVILDGEATKLGNRARGSRFNSTLRYVELQRKRALDCVALVVSEDGYVNLLPDINPPLSREVLTEYEATLDELLKTKDFGSILAHRVRSWFHNHAFYLNQDQCAKANQLTHNVMEHDKKNSAIWVEFKLLQASLDGPDKMYFSP